MENASKALLMAAGVLIGILLISLAVYLFVDFGSTSAQINTQNAEKQLTQFNSKFTSYIGKEGLTIYDVITVAGYARENNNRYSESLDENKITVQVIADKVYNNFQDNNLQASIENFTNKNTGELTNFTCDVTSYHNNGRVANVIFKWIK